jgi:hypothetical protein
MHIWSLISESGQKRDLQPESLIHNFFESDWVLRLVLELDCVVLSLP